MTPMLIALGLLSQVGRPYAQCQAVQQWTRDPVTAVASSSRVWTPEEAAQIVLNATVVLLANPERYTLAWVRAPLPAAIQAAELTGSAAWDIPTDVAERALATLQWCQGAGFRFGPGG